MALGPVTVISQVKTADSPSFTELGPVILKFTDWSVELAEDGAGWEGVVAGVGGGTPAPGLPPGKVGEAVAGLDVPGRLCPDGGN
jgi:hypothetical protein